MSSRETPEEDYRSGEAWSPEGAESPHQYDYKLSIMGRSSQEELVGMLDEERRAPGTVPFFFDWFRQHGSFRRFTHSQDKMGLFIQASCIVTNGFRSQGARDITHVLLAERSPTQFHMPSEPRHKSGPSVLFSTALASFGYQDPLGHVPTALFNDLNSYCPWSLFGRKLLLPDIHMDARFLGIAYNFERPDRRYVFLVWHVRTKKMPEAMLVPVRQKRNYDVPAWTPLEPPPLKLLDSDIMGRLTLSVALTGSVDAASAGDDRLVGFLPQCRFEGVAGGRGVPCVVRRDEVGLDLLRMYQQEFHGGRRRITGADDRGGRERELQEDFYLYLDETLKRHGIRAALQWEGALGPMPKAGRADLRLVIRDEDGAPMYNYMFECKRSKSSKTREGYVAQGMEYCAALSKAAPNARLDEGVDAVFIVHGIDGEENRYALQDTITIPSADIPLHVVRIALNPIAPSEAVETVDVAHALIPVRVDGGPPEYLLFVQGPDDVCPQVLGGKSGIVSGRLETPQQTLLREMREEMGLRHPHVREFRAMFPGSPGKPAGIPFRSLSVTRGVYRNYRFHPFLVFLTEDGKRHVRSMLHKPDHYARPLKIGDWAEHGFGHAPDYAKAVLPYLNEELLGMAAVEITRAEVERDACGPAE